MQVETVFPAADGTPMPAVLTVPDGADGPVPGVLMIYEIFGMSDEMRRVRRSTAGRPICRGPARSWPASAGGTWGCAAHPRS